MSHQTETHESGPQRATGILRMVVLWALGLYICVVPPADAQDCTFPDNVDWVVDQSCEISVIRIAPRNLSVIDGAVLTIEGSGELILDTRNFRLSVDPDSRLAVAPGGRIRSNQIGPLLVRRTDGGPFGYFLKRVGGPIIDTINPDLSFHPSSAIKTLYMIEALRQVDNGTLNLGTTLITSCPTVITVVPPVPPMTCPNQGQGASCPNPPFACARSAGGEIAPSSRTHKRVATTIPHRTTSCALVSVQ